MPSPLRKFDKRDQKQPSPPSLARQVPGATSEPTKNVPLPNCEIGDFSGERSWVQVGQPSDEKLLSVAAIVTMVGPRGYSLAMVWPPGPIRCQEQIATGPTRVRYVPGAISTPTTFVPLPKTAMAGGVGGFVEGAVGGVVARAVGVEVAATGEFASLVGATVCDGVAVGEGSAVAAGPACDEGGTAKAGVRLGAKVATRG